MRRGEHVTILAAQNWKTNADMMVDVGALYIKSHDLVYDPTYGKGGFWKKFRPINLFVDDINPEKGSGGDFRDMDWADDTFDVVVFDPAYVTPGGRETSSIQTMNEAYGMDTTKLTLDEQWQDIRKGMSECVRVLKPRMKRTKNSPGHPGGLLMQKCMNYVSSGEYQDYLDLVKAEMRSLGLTVIDVFYFIRSSAGPQDKNRMKKCPVCKEKPAMKVKDVCQNCRGYGRVPVAQVHASNNLSFLVVGRK